MNKKTVKINPEDLLNREKISIDDPAIKEHLQGKNILLTGAAGFIGSDLARHLLALNPASLILLDQSETGLYDLELSISAYKIKDTKLIYLLADITNEARMKAIFTRQPLDLVLHSAAYKHVPMLERAPAEAVLCNVQGTRILADLALQYKVKKFVLVSTDKAIQPTSVMGASKRIAEQYIQSLQSRAGVSAETSFIIVRFGNVLGSAGSVMPMFEKQMNEGGPLTVTHPEVTRFFMTVSEASQLVLLACATGNGGDTFLADMGEPVKIVDLAKKMIRLCGLTEGKDINIIFTGLREGEKLMEVLLANPEDEHVQATKHSRILKERISSVGDYEQMLKNVKELVRLAGEEDEMKLVGKMKMILPEYKSNASRFEVLD